MLMTQQHVMFTANTVTMNMVNQFWQWTWSISFNTKDPNIYYPDPLSLSNVFMYCCELEIVHRHTICIWYAYFIVLYYCIVLYIYCICTLYTVFAVQPATKQHGWPFLLSTPPGHCMVYHLSRAGETLVVSSCASRIRTRLRGLFCR